MRLPCLDCELDCEAKVWLVRAFELHKAGVDIKRINLPCPRDGVTYEVGPIKGGDR